MNQSDLAKLLVGSCDWSICGELKAQEDVGEGCMEWNGLDLQRYPSVSILVTVIVFDVRSYFKIFAPVNSLLLDQLRGQIL